MRRHNSASVRMDWHAAAPIRTAGEAGRSSQGDGQSARGAPPDLPLLGDLRASVRARRFG